MSCWRLLSMHMYGILIRHLPSTDSAVIGGDAWRSTFGFFPIPNHPKRKYWIQYIICIVILSYSIFICWRFLSMNMYGILIRHLPSTDSPVMDVFPIVGCEGWRSTFGFLLITNHPKGKYWIKYNVLIVLLNLFHFKFDISKW